MRFVFLVVRSRDAHPVLESGRTAGRRRDQPPGDPGESAPGSAVVAARSRGGGRRSAGRARAGAGRVGLSAAVSRSARARRRTWRRRRTDSACRAAWPCRRVGRGVRRAAAAGDPAIRAGRDSQQRPQDARACRRGGPPAAGLAPARLRRHTTRDGGPVALERAALGPYCRQLEERVR